MTIFNPSRRFLLKGAVASAALAAVAAPAFARVRVKHAGDPFIEGLIAR